MNRIKSVIEKINAPIIKNKKNVLYGTMVVVFLAAALVYYFADYNSNKTLSTDEAATKSLAYIDQILTAQGSTYTTSLESVSEESGVYAITFKIATYEYTSYVTKDGKYLFPDAYDMSDFVVGEGTESTETAADTCDTLIKADSPVLEAFVVSACPYGLQMQRILAEVVDLIPSLTENIKVRYLGAISDGKISSMHGDTEAQENLRQICLREEQPTKYWDYVSCYMKDGDTDGCLESASVDATSLGACMTDSSRGLAYAQVDFDLQDSYGVTGSPTLFINGTSVSEYDFGGRTAEALRTIICCSFNEQSEACSVSLTNDSAATGFSEDYAGTSGSSGSCN
jgi:hypothetical protein